VKGEGLTVNGEGLRVKNEEIEKKGKFKNILIKIKVLY